MHFKQLQTELVAALIAGGSTMGPDTLKLP